MQKQWNQRIEQILNVMYWTLNAEHVTTEYCVSAMEQYQTWWREGEKNENKRIWNRRIRILKMEKTTTAKSLHYSKNKHTTRTITIDRSLSKNRFDPKINFLWRKIEKHRQIFNLEQKIDFSAQNSGNLFNHSTQRHNNSTINI